MHSVYINYHKKNSLMDKYAHVRICWLMCCYHYFAYLINIVLSRMGLEGLNVWVLNNQGGLAAFVMMAGNALIDSNLLLGNQITLH